MIPLDMSSPLLQRVIHALLFQYSYVPHALSPRGTGTTNSAQGRAELWKREIAPQITCYKC